MAVADKLTAPGELPAGGGDPGRGLTEKRRRVLELLLEAPKPLSAYELTDAYNRLYEPAIKAMSVYRILDYLASQHWIHRLHSANKYLACGHPRGCDPHPLALFLICTGCEQVEETVVDGHLQCLLAGQTAHSGFCIQDSQLEISGLCAACQAKRNTHETAFTK